MAAQTVRLRLTLFAAAALVRTVPVLYGLGQYFTWRIEVSTPVNSLLQLREGLTLASYGVSPYKGSSCHIPPVVLWFYSATAQHPWLYALPNILLDLIAAVFLTDVAVSMQTKAQGSTHKLLAAMYLLNPFQIMSCISGSISPLENACVLAAIATACSRRALLSGVALACSAYTGVHPAILVVPIMVLIYNGPEQSQDQEHLGPAHADTAAHRPGSSTAIKPDVAHHSGSSSSTVSNVAKQPGGSHSVAVEAAGDHQSSSTVMKPTAMDAPNGMDAVQLLKQTPSAARSLRSSVMTFVASFLLSLCTLIGLSDQLLANYPEEQCSLWLVDWLNGQLNDNQSCWLPKAYRLHWMIDDVTPTIGQFWYFFMEVFDHYKPFFRFVAHSHAVIFTVPLAVRFSHRPMFLIFCQLLIISLFKPYPSIADFGIYLPMLLLFPHQLRRLKVGMFLIVTFLLLAVLGPAMWHQWIDTESANSNFFYSITLCIGAWQVLLLVQMLLCTIEVDDEPHMQSKG